jgi:hypothetical protein
MSGACDTYRVEEWFIKGFGGETCEGMRLLGRSGHRWGDNIKMDLKVIRIGCRLD